MLPLCIPQDSSKLCVMFRAAWCCWHERFLDGLIEVFVGEHEVKQPGRFVMMVVKRVPIHEVMAIGLKLAGEEESETADDFLRSFTDATFQAVGTTEVAQHRLKMSRATMSAGHVLNTKYGILSTGDDLDLFTGWTISAMEISSSLNLTTGAREDGNQEGWVKVHGVDW